MNYHFHGGPFEGLRTSQLVLGEWVVLFFDEHRQRTSAQNAFALAAYKQEIDADEICFRFAHCLTPKLQKFQIEYADGPFRGFEVSVLPIIWRPLEIVLPLDNQARAMRGDRLAPGGATFLARYERREFAQGHKYCLAKIALVPSSQFSPCTAA